MEAGLGARAHAASPIALWKLHSNIYVGVDTV